MSLPSTPDPFPTLKEGLALGADDHTGFVNVWNWIAGIMRQAKDYFTFGVNGRSGDLNLVAGEGISVTTEGQTIMISLGNGENTDNDTGTGGGGGGTGGGGGGTGGGGGGGTGTGGGGGGTGSGTSDRPDWTDVPLPEPPSSDGGSTNCNTWEKDPYGMGPTWGDEPPNGGDNCNELNGW